jgi:hypothetical protein
MHKGFKCLEISSGQIYISHDVVFDETCIPFAVLPFTAGSRYISEVLLLPEPSSNGNNTDLPSINMLNRSHMLSVSASLLDADHPEDPGHCIFLDFSCEQ